MRGVLYAAILIAIIFAIGFLWSTVYARIQRRKALWLENPMIAGMTRKDRRAFSKELRAREQKQYEDQLQQDLEDRYFNRKDVA